jgi:hypothetical protein
VDRHFAAAAEAQGAADNEGTDREEVVANVDLTAERRTAAR